MPTSTSYKITSSSKKIYNAEGREPFKECQPPFPGDMCSDAPDFDITYDRIYDPIKIGTIDLSFSENIENLILQIDESMVLGYIEDLVSFGPRVTSSTACYEAGDYIYNQFENMGLDAEYQYWSDGSYHGNNIEGTIYGQDPTSDEIYVVCGHYDSVPGSPGADDNAAGTAAVLAAAEVMSQYNFNHTVKFVAFPGEEQGLYGSHYYVQDAYNNGDNIVAALNADMIGYALTEDDGSKIKIYHDTASTWIMDYTESISIMYDNLIDLTIIDSGYASNSDHYRFWQYGYNAIMYHENKFNPYYHSSQDTVDKMNMTYDKKVTRLIMATLAELAEPAQLEIGITNLNSKWNFISLPFNQTINLDNLIIKYNGINYNWIQATTDDNPTGNPIIDLNVYKWDRINQIYTSTTKLEQGHGYWMYSYYDCDLLIIGEEPFYDNHITNLENQWSIIGIPSDKSVNLIDLIVTYNEADYTWAEAIDPINGPIIDPNIYGWNVLLQTYIPISILEPGKAYWIYAYQYCTLQR